MFELVRNLYGGAEIAPPLDNAPFTAGETLTAGQVCYFHTDGKLKKAADTERAAAVVLISGGANNETVRGYYILPGMVFKAPGDGTWSAACKVGFSNVELADDGKKVNREDPTGDDGPLSILKIQGNGEYLWVCFNRGFFFKNDDTVST